MAGRFADGTSLSPGHSSKWWGKTGPPAEMAAWIGGVNRGPIHLLHPVVLRVMCESRIGLVSDYRPDQPAAPPFLQPYPKDGLAVTGTQRVERLKSCLPSRPNGLPRRLLNEEFDRAEQEASGAHALEDPIPRSFRRKTPVEIEAMYRAPMDEAAGRYYVEASSVTRQVRRTTAAASSLQRADG